MNTITEPYLDQVRRWPKRGRHILASFDEASIVVYQAYRPSIGRFAVEHRRFGGEFSMNRMSWIKPNFLWMMYRSGWGTKLGQEVVLAIRLRRDAFDEILARAVHSAYLPEVYGSPEGWKEHLAESPVRLQWDPDHDPGGHKQERRALQLGLSGEILRRFATDWIVSIEDISAFVAEQRVHAHLDGFESLVTPREECYPVSHTEVAHRLQLDPH